jgi:superfamily II DNA/RNA helicase
LFHICIKAEAYIDVANSCKKEHINYLTNSFSNGGLPILITTQEAGKNLSNPNIRFVIHYDVPANPDLYKLHVMQIGKLANEPIVHDFFTC